MLQVHRLSAVAEDVSECEGGKAVFRLLIFQKVLHLTSSSVLQTDQGSGVLSKEGGES